MSLDFTYDYSNHTLLDNANKYSKLYKLIPVEASQVTKGDLVLVKTDCGKYGLFISVDDTNEDNVLHLSSYHELDFVTAD